MYLNKEVEGKKTINNVKVISKPNRDFEVYTEFKFDGFWYNDSVFFGSVESAMDKAKELIRIDNGEYISVCNGYSFISTDFIEVV